MTALTDAQRLFLPAALLHQEPVLNSPSRRKLWNAGRRTGKSRAALIAVTIGHGDRVTHLPGIADGANGVWLQRDYPNLRAIWREELEPRFLGRPGVDLNQAERRISLAGAGRLELRSAENIDSVRGAALDFAVLDEGAYFDLAYALNDVILPALLDRAGWLLVISSPNKGHDGNPDHLTPSYFNRLCQEVMSGERAEWRYWHNRTEDNETLTPEAVTALRAEYPPGTATARQELDAELLVGGVGFALPHLDWEAMKVAPFDPPSDWLRFGSFDWGYNHPFSFGAWIADPDGNVYRTHSITSRHETPEQIHVTVNQGVELNRLKYIVAGPDIWNVDKAKGQHVPSVADQLTRRGWPLVPAANTGTRPRVLRLDNFRRYCGWPATETLPAFPSRLRVFDTPANRVAFAAWAQMLLDPNDEEAPLKVDADANGKGGDDAFDEASYGLASRPLVLPKKQKDSIKEHDKAMPIDYEKRGPKAPTYPGQSVGDVLVGLEGHAQRFRHTVPRWKP